MVVVMRVASSVITRPKSSGRAPAIVVETPNWFIRCWKPSISASRGRLRSVSGSSVSSAQGSSVSAAFLAPEIGNGAGKALAALDDDLVHRARLAGFGGASGRRSRRHARLTSCASRLNGCDARPAMTASTAQADPQSRVPRRRARHALPARDQGDPQGDAADHRPAADPVRGRRGARGGDRADDLRHRARQDRDRRAFRHRLRARDDDERARQGHVGARRRPGSRPATSSPCASRCRWASATRSGARARSSATSRSRSCCPTS